MAAISFASAVATFLPRFSIEIGEPTEPSDPFSAAVTVINTLVPLERVSLGLGLCEIQYGQLRFQSRDNPSCEAGTKVFIVPPEMRNHRLATDDKWRVLLSSFGWGRQNGLDPNKIAFTGGDITMMLHYSPWPLSYLHADWLFGREKQFRFTAQKVGKGWQWFPSTIDKS